MSSDISIKYGANYTYKDITNLALKHCVKNGILNIRETDVERAILFSDTCKDVLKDIIITINGVEKIYPAGKKIEIDISDIDLSEYQLSPNKREWFDREANPLKQLQLIQQNTLLKFGPYSDEFYEQLMAVNYIKPTAKVLEIGGNIGRNSLVIATILYDQSNLVTLESSQSHYMELQENKYINGYTFNVENSALSYRKLVQKGDVTIPSDVDLPGHSPVKCMTFQDIEKKYNIKFDTLVADCEGALYYIFGDYPDMLDNINLIIMENDYEDINHKIFVDKVLTEKGFECVLYSGGNVSWGPCRYNFYEVWCK